MSISRQIAKFTMMLTTLSSNQNASQNTS